MAFIFLDTFLWLYRQYLYRFSALYFFSTVWSIRNPRVLFWPLYDIIFERFCVKTWPLYSPSIRRCYFDPISVMRSFTLQPTQRLVFNTWLRFLRRKNSQVLLHDGGCSRGNDFWRTWVYINYEMTYWEYTLSNTFTTHQPKMPIYMGALQVSGFLWLWL